MISQILNCEIAPYFSTRVPFFFRLYSQRHLRENSQNENESLVKFIISRTTRVQIIEFIRQLLGINPSFLVAKQKMVPHFLRIDREKYSKYDESLKLDSFK